MKRLLLACLAVLVLACAKTAPVVQPFRPFYLDAVKPLQVKTEGLSEHTIVLWQAEGWKLNLDGFSNVCTVSHVSRELHLWVTAAHCVTEIGPEGRYVEGQGVEVVEADAKRDVAIIRVKTLDGGPVVLKFATEPATWTTRLTVVGHPFGYDPVFVTRGFVSNPFAHIEGKDYITFDVAGAPGNSGSPVLNEFGEIVSILQIGWGRVFSPMTGGATADEMVYIRGFVK